MADDLPFYEATRQCSVSADAHPFRLRVLIGERTTYLFDQDTAFTRCLSREAAAKDENGNQRRRSLGVQLENAVRMCETKFGPIGSFFIDFEPARDGDFSVHRSPDSTKAHGCVAFFSLVIQPRGFGAQR
ncbi:MULTISPECIES: hypothetical protein [Ralstonia]|uniref:hypothetical protein n=1 Tax=Ralstonia TaxID=48736 RepID=UPI00126828E7|nr:MULTISPECIES: hypothetical protein [Ralstonia]